MQGPKGKGRTKAAKHITEQFASRICGAADKEGLAPGQFFDALMLAYVAVASSMPGSMGSCSAQLSACAGDLLKKHADHASKTPATCQ